MLQHGAGGTFLVTKPEPEPSSDVQPESASLAPREECSLPSPRPDPASFEEMHDEILRILFRNESPEEREAAEQSGGISRRLLLQCWVGAADTIESLRLLLAANADVNVRDRQNISPLGHALRALKRIRLEDEVRRAFNPDADFKLDEDWTEEPWSCHSEFAWQSWLEVV